jgi:hypothetical protein
MDVSEPTSRAIETVVLARLGMADDTAKAASAQIDAPAAEK